MEDNGKITFGEWLHYTERLLKRIGKGFVRRFSQKWVWQVIGIVILLAFALTAALLGLGSLNHWWKSRGEEKTAKVQLKEEAVITANPFHGSLCVKSDGHAYGLVDTTGKWVLEPRYSEIDHLSGLGEIEYYWVLMAGDSLRLVDDNLREVIPMLEAYYVELCTDSTFVVSRYGVPSIRFSLTGERLPGYCFNEVSVPCYKSVDGNLVPCPHNLVYSVGTDFQGLLSLDGTLLTEAVYSDIEALGPNIFKCELSATGQYILLDSGGKQIDKK